MFEAPMALRSAQLLFVVLAGVQGSQIKSVGDLQGTSKSMFVPGHDGDAVTVAIAADGRIDTLTTVDSEFSGSQIEHADVTDPVHRDAMSAYVEADGSIHRMANVVSESSGARRTDEHGDAADSLATVAKVRSVGGRLVDPSERLEEFFKSLTHRTDLDGKLTSRTWGRNVRKNKDLIAECFGDGDLAEMGKKFTRMGLGKKKQKREVTWDLFVAAALPACGGSDLKKSKVCLAGVEDKDLCESNPMCEYFETEGNCCVKDSPDYGVPDKDVVGSCAGGGGGHGVDDGSGGGGDFDLGQPRYRGKTLSGLPDDEDEVVDDTRLEKIFRMFSPDGSPIKGSRAFGRKLNMKKIKRGKRKGNVTGDAELAEEVRKVFCLPGPACEQGKEGCSAGEAYYKIKGEKGTLTKEKKQETISFDEFKTAAQRIPHPCSGSGGGGIELGVDGDVVGGDGEVVGGGGHDDATLEAIFLKFSPSLDTPIKNSKQFGRKLNLNPKGRKGNGKVTGDEGLAKEVGQVFCLDFMEAGKAYWKIKELRQEKAKEAPCRSNTGGVGECEEAQHCKYSTMGPTMGCTEKTKKDPITFEEFKAAAKRMGPCP